MNLWQRKLLAFLHDPPSKPFQVADHREVAAALIRNAFPDMVPGTAARFFDKVCDHTAAAADRVVCPKARAMKADWQAEAASFKHPLGGGTVRFEQKITAATAEEIVTGAQPHALPYSTLSAAKQDWARFFCHWRLWPQECARRDPRMVHLPADTRIPDHTIWTHCSLVSALQTCVETTGEGEKIELREFKPAFLLVQIGPVQEFISQARPTRDLWSGSYLLSWIIAHGIKAVTDRVGPDCVLFPALRGQPLFDFLHKGELYDPLELWEQVDAHGHKHKMHADEQVLTPNLPNRFLAVVPQASFDVGGNRIPSATELAAFAEQAMRHELEEGISEACMQWLSKHHPVTLDGGDLQRWRQQLRQFLAVHWQVSPWDSDVAKAIQRFKDLPLGSEKAENQTVAPAEAHDRAYDAARKGIPANDLDPRNYRHQSWREGDFWKSEIIPGSDQLPMIENPGFAWAAHYARTEFLLAARRNTRDFARWGVISDASAEVQKQANDSRQGATKDVLSGKEETIGPKEWQEKLVKLPGHLFRESDRLGAINIVKRIWLVAYLEAKYQLKRRRVAFDSVPAIAAGSWRRTLINKVREDEAVWHDFLDFAAKAVAARNLEYFDNIPKEAPDQDGRVDERKWLDWVDSTVFHQNEWQRAIRDESKREGDPRAGAVHVLTEALKALSKLQRVGKPLSYVAILAMDGDSMGQWVSGARSPKWREQLAEEAREYFEKSHPDAKSPDALKQLLDAPRHVSPSYHLQFSEALANFSLYLAAPIVEAFDGQLIYSGGDDVLAMLPAENALDCARALRMAFRGDPELCTVFGGALDVRLRDSENEPLPSDKQPGWGFVAVNGNWPEWQRWQRNAWPRGYHLLVPGKHADISAGIAIGHMHTPLQNLVEAARQAEKDAKREKEKGGYGKSAFAVHLYKRSGELIRWGAKWAASAIELADIFSQLTDGEKLSGRFPYALADNLRRYTATPCPTLEAKPKPFRIETVNGFEAGKVFLCEFEHVLRQQSAEEWRRNHPGETEQFRTLTAHYLDHCAGRELDDFLGPFLTTTFIRKASN